MLTQLAVHAHVAVVHELARGEDGGHELGAVDHRVEPPLQERDQVLAGVAAHALGLGEDAAELLLGQIAVVALELLLGAKLEAEVRHLALAPLAVLAGAVLAAVHGDFGRPQMFSPMRRSILYLAAVRLVTADLLCDEGVVLSGSRGDRPPLAGAANTK